MPCKRKAQTSTTKVAAKQGIASQKIPKTIYGCIVEFHESTVESSLLTKHNDQVASKGFTSTTHYNCTRETVVSNIEKAKASEARTRFDCITNAHKSTRQRIESVTKRIREEHIAGRGQNSVSHYNVVHKFIPMPQAMKIPAAKATVDKEWEKLEKISAWNLTKVRSRKEVIDEARTSGASVHFASLMDKYHLKNAELEAKHQKYKGRAVLRGDIVKDDSGSYAVFTERGSSAPQMTAA